MDEMEGGREKDTHTHAERGVQEVCVCSYFLGELVDFARLGTVYVCTHTNTPSETLLSLCVRARERERERARARARKECMCVCV